MRSNGVQILQKWLREGSIPELKIKLIDTSEPEKVNRCVCGEVHEVNN